jgi:hypothetical protein
MAAIRCHWMCNQDSGNGDLFHAPKNGITHSSISVQALVAEPVGRVRRPQRPPRFDSPFIALGRKSRMIPRVW